MPTPTETIIKQHENLQSSMGEVLSSLAHARLKQLLDSLAPYFNLTYLLMGNGGWLFNCEPEFTATTYSGEKCQYGGADFSEMVSGQRAIRVSKPIRAQLNELNVLLNWMTDTKHISVMDWKRES